MDDLSEFSGFGDYSGNTDMGDYPQYPDKDTEQMAQDVILGDRINFWVNGVLNMPISVLGIIGEFKIPAYTWKCKKYSSFSR